MKRPLWLPLLAGIVLYLSMMSTGQAHNRSESFSQWTLTQSEQATEITGVFNVLEREATRIPFPADDARPLGERLIDYLETRVAFSTPDGACSRMPPVLLSARPGYLRIRYGFICDGTGISLRMEPFLDLAPGHIHYARIKLEDRLSEFLFSARDTEAVLVTEQGEVRQGGAGFGRYVLLGMEHIVSGLDHLAFVLAVMLLAGTVRNALWAVTGFTIGHSLTLALAVLGLAKPNGQVVEALIGFTIALTVMEYAIARSGRLLWAVALLSSVLLAMLFFSDQPVVMAGLLLFSLCYLLLDDRLERPERLLRPGVTAIFGLVHGFGFAGLLLEMGLPRDRVVEALLGFNIGVEIGQLLFVAFVGSLVFLWIRLKLFGETMNGLFRDGLVAGLAGIGLFWFADRLI